MGEVENPGAGLASLAAEINAEHRRFMGSVKTTLEHGIRCGELLSEAKKRCPHGTWLAWLNDNFEGSVRSAQEYMRLYENRDEILGKYADAAHLTLSGALKALTSAEEVRPEWMPPDEWEVVRAALKAHWHFEGVDLDRLAPLPEGERRGFVAEMAWFVLCVVVRDYRLWVHSLPEDVTRASPEMLAELKRAADVVRWWVEQVEWLEGLIRARDWPPGRGMPRAALDPELRDRLMPELYDDEGEDGMRSPRGFVRELAGNVV